MDRVQKLLSNYGYCSRRKAEDLIAEGRVQVNGKTIKLGDQAEFEDKITVDGEVVRPEERVYYMFHKPIGCVTALTDERYRTIMDFIKIEERVIPVGRLDYNTSGLLLLTNDGDFANKVMHPRYEVKKTYLVRLDKPIGKEQVKQVESGVELEDGKTSPAKVFMVNKQLLELKLHEGKNRIVRRIFEHLGYSVVQLKRIKIGKLDLGNLAVKKYRELTKSDMQKIFVK